MTPELKEYYQLYKEWLDNKAPEMEPFSRHKGIRQNLLMVLGADKPAAMELLDEIQMDMLKERVHLTRSFGDSLEATLQEYESGTCHLNPKRIAWVTERAK